MEPKYYELAQALSNACASPSKKLIRPKDVAAMLGISRKQLYLLAQDKDFPEKIKIGDFIIKTIQTSHSIPDPVSFLISTKEGDIFHSGDWKLEQAKNLNENFDFDTYRSLGNNGV